MPRHKRERLQDLRGWKTRRAIHCIMIALLLAGWIIYQATGRATAMLLLGGLDLVILIWEIKRRIEEE